MEIREKEYNICAKYILSIMSSCQKCNKWNPFSMFMEKPKVQTTRKYRSKNNRRKTMRGGYNPKKGKGSKRK